MPTPPYLQSPHAGYVALASCAPNALNSDQARSVLYFLTDQSMEITQPAPEGVPARVISWVRSARALDTFVTREGRLHIRGATYIRLHRVLRELRYCYGATAAR
jgi:hypothetical protein